MARARALVFNVKQVTPLEQGEDRSVQLLPGLHSPDRRRRHLPASGLDAVLSGAAALVDLLKGAKSKLVSPSHTT